MSVIVGARRAAAELDAIEGRPSELEDIRDVREILDFTVRMIHSLSELVRGIAIKIDRDEGDLILDGVTDPGAGADRRAIEHARALSSWLRRRSRAIAELDELLTAAERLSSRHLLMLEGFKEWLDVPEWERSVFVVEQVDFDLASSSIGRGGLNAPGCYPTRRGRWHLRSMAAAGGHR